MKQTLRPRGSGELIGQSLGLLFGNFGKLLVIHVGFWIPVAFVIGLMIAGAVAADAPALGFVSILIGFVLAPVPNAASIIAISDEFTGRSTSIGACFGIAFRRLGTLIGLGFVTGILIGIGMIFLLIPGLYLLAKWYVSTQVCLLENEGVGGAMERSSDLTKGSRGEILGVSVVIGLIGYAVVIPLTFWEISVREAGADGAALVSLLVDMVSNIVFGLLFACTAVAIYFNQRVKKDSFDLEALSGLVDEIGRRGAAAT